MLEFPIEEFYRRVAKFDALREDKGTIIGAGAGFFYWYNDEVFFVTNRDHIAIEEKAYLPDSIILYLNTVSENSYGSKITLQLFDKAERPVWRVLASDSGRIFVSIPIPKAILKLDYTHYFFAQVRFPSTVCLPVDDIILNIPVSTGVSVADYFFYSNSQNGKTLQKRIEERDDFRINRRGFATDMVEMVLVLLQHNLYRLWEAGKKKGSSEKIKDEISTCMKIHDNLVHELEKIMIQFSDVLEPSIFERIQKIFTILKEGNPEDYFAVRHLIYKVLMLLGQNILFTQ
jgi:hypothetical protein